MFIHSHLGLITRGIHYHLHHLQESRISRSHDKRISRLSWTLCALPNIVCSARTLFYVLSYKWPCSIAMSNYQRVTYPSSELLAIALFFLAIALFLSPPFLVGGRNGAIGRHWSWWLATQCACLYVYMYIYIYTHIDREREKEMKSREYAGCWWDIDGDAFGHNGYTLAT